MDRFLDLFPEAPRRTFLREAPAAFRPKLLDRDRINVGPEPGLRLVLLRTAKNDDERFLGQLFGPGGVVQTPPEEAIDRDSGSVRKVLQTPVAIRA